MRAVGAPELTSCVACGRQVEWRKKWARDGDHVRYCSQKCRSTGVSSTDRALEEAIVALLVLRGSGKTICPSEAAREIGGDDWRELMEPARAAARRLVARGDVDITQGGQVVDPSTAKGPIRIRRKR